MTDSPPLPPPQDRGALVIRDKVVETIVRQAAASESVVQRANGLSRLVTDDLPRAKATVHAGTVAAAVTVAAPWPTPATGLAERIRATVAKHLCDQTGLTVSRVDVAVVYVSQPDQKVRRVQ